MFKQIFYVDTINAYTVVNYCKLKKEDFNKCSIL